MMKLALMRPATGKEDLDLPLLKRKSSLELTAPQIAAQSSSNRNISTSTIQRRLRESGLHGRITANKPLLKDTNKKKLVWAKKHEQWILGRWKSVLWSDESKFDIFGSNRHVFVRCRVGEWMISACVMVWGCLLVTLSVIYIEFKAHLTSMATTAFCSDKPSHLVCT
ncbi:unnamed protein product [Oncorhynchus mykiss]|uniref:Transposase Tc1-like domain-containing protein n=1 Tax=Oncorhynchus mykiss TaxID=8022 RepID=A0A060X3G1_ONCMY|nr:unnamed protein product [Oncorhynchus mykiss]